MTRGIAIVALAAVLACVGAAAWGQEADGAGEPPSAVPAEPLPDEMTSGRPPPAEPRSSVPPDMLRRLAGEADEVWRIAILASERARDRALLRFGDRVALTQADLGRRIDRLARSQGLEAPAVPTPEAARRIASLRGKPPAAVAATLTTAIRQSYPRILNDLQGWTAGPERAVADALLPSLREELVLAERLGNPALTGSSTAPR
ncbi:MAG TPA: hypothetical protein VD978_05340 [Azospirillum sp.]|nr:hypothetical protein [Azospirillum sp.]